MAPAVVLERITKIYPGVIANQDVDWTLEWGQIHALLGENGAGKSTLMKILSGMIAPEAGTVEVGGRDVTGWSTAQAIAAGVGMVHQHFMLVPTLTVAENVVLGREPVNVGTFDRTRAVREVEELSRQSGLVVPADRLVADLSVGEAQRVEILKTLYRGARVLLLDEPTAVLSPPEVAELWGVLRRVRDAGTTIILITHKLDEVMAVTERITVMRQGATVARLATRGTTPEGIAKAMVGREVDLVVKKSEARSKSQEGSGLTVRNLVVRGNRIARAVNDISLTVAPGEILGIAGVEGNGQSELVEAITGLQTYQGQITYLGKTARGVREVEASGLSHVPEDRNERGLVLEMTTAENFILGEIGRAHV